MKYETLSDRMKGAYENKYRIYLTERLPVIIRLDGKSFHTFCRGLKKPFDPLFIKVMQQTMLKLCENISGCKLGYIQSDEISLLLMQDRNESQPWFDNNLQKIVSVSASMATLYFNKFFEEACFDYLGELLKLGAWNVDENDPLKEEEKYLDILSEKSFTATFDSRVFLLPKEEVNNYFLWRQQDATRNSILSLAQSLYSDKEMKGVKCDALQDKMFTEKGVNWNELSTVEKRGTCAIKVPTEINDKVRNKWTLDTEIPIFSQDKEYINKIVYGTGES